MVFWPFRRKSSRRHTYGGVDHSQGDTMHAAAGTQRGHDAISDPMSGPERRRSRRGSRWNRRSSKENKKLQRNPDRQRTYSFSPGRNDSIRVLPSDRPPVPPLPLVKGANRKGTADREKFLERPQRARTEPPEDKQDWQRVPTLHKRSAQDLLRRKSSKKRKAEHDREEEIKAMALIMPTRPATDLLISGRPMKRENKRMRDGSNISLPSAESLHSSLSTHEDQTSFKVSVFEALAPRPTIRYGENSRSHLSKHDRSQSRRISERVSIPEETLKANKRVHDLADDLDAGELRQLMERDKKRREKKKIADKLKIEKKLAKRQQNQKEEEAAAVRNGTPSPVNMERGVLGRDVVGLGIESGTSAVITSSKRRGSATSRSSRSKRPADLFQKESTTRPVDDFHRSESLMTEALTPGAEREDPVIGMARLGTVTKANISPPSSPTIRGHQRGASSISQMMDLVKATNSTPAPTPAKTATQPILIPSRKVSENNNEVSTLSWKSFFRRTPKPKRDSAPSSFSNTSRDSMQAGQGPSMRPTQPMRIPSSLPKRTMSKFREDLPELPLSPPMSRVQSPDADVVPPIREYPERRNAHRVSSDEHPRYDTPMSGLRSLEIARIRGETPTSGHRSVEAPSPEPTGALSQSLASVDSEGSWLSGRKGGSKRGSTQLPSHPLHESASSLDQRYKNFSESNEELGIAEDEYFSRLTPGPEDHFRINRQSATVPSSDDEGGSIQSPLASEDTKWGTVTRTPTVVHREPRAKSREGLLNDFESASGSDIAGETPEDVNRTSDGFNEEEEGLQRATSIDLGKDHVRRISAGSARLLDLKKAPGEKRVSSG